MKKSNSVRALQAQIRGLQAALAGASAAHGRELDRANRFYGQITTLVKENTWLKRSHDMLAEAIFAGAREGIFPRRNISDGR